MELHPEEILMYIINILVLFVLLRLILWRPVLKYLSARTERVRDELGSAEKTLRDAEALKTEYAEKIGELEAHGREIVRESQITAAGEAEEIIKEARAQADSLLRDARERIADEKAQAVIAARAEIARLAADMAAGILKREVSANDNRQAVDDFFRESR